MLSSKWREIVELTRCSFKVAIANDFTVKLETLNFSFGNISGLKSNPSMSVIEIDKFHFRDISRYKNSIVVCWLFHQLSSVLPVFSLKTTRASWKKIMNRNSKKEKIFMATTEINNFINNFVYWKVSRESNFIDTKIEKLHTIDFNQVKWSRENHVFQVIRLQNTIWWIELQITLTHMESLLSLKVDEILHHMNRKLHYHKLSLHAQKCTWDNWDNQWPSSQS